MTITRIFTTGISLLVWSSAASAQAEEVSFTREWAFSNYGSDIGRAGMADCDIDGDGVSELIFASTAFGALNNNVWSIQSFDATRGTYQLAWQSLPYPRGIGSLILNSSDAHSPQVLVGALDGTLESWSLADRKILMTSQLYSPIRDITYYPNYRSDQNAILVLTDAALHWLHADTLTELKSHPNEFGARTALIGNTDNDSHPEIVLDSGLVLEESVGGVSVEWDRGYAFGHRDGFGDEVALADSNADGIEEIVGAKRFGTISAYSVATRERLWEIDPGAEVNALTLEDINGDGVSELLFGEGQFGRLVALDIETRQRVLAVTNPTSGFSHIHIAPVHPDLESRIIWGGGHNSSEPDYLHVASLSSHSIEWSNSPLLGPFNALAIHHISSDEPRKLIFASSSADAASAGTVGIVDTRDFTVDFLESLDFLEGAVQSYVHTATAGDLDGDGTAEIILGGALDHYGVVYIVDGETKRLRSKTLLVVDSPIHHVKVADMDGDGLNEVVAVGGKSSSGTEIVSASFIDSTGKVTWQSPDLYPAAYHGLLDLNPLSLEIGNIDDDTALEAVIALGDIVVIDGNSKEVTRLELARHDEIATGVTLFDINLDQIQDVFYATELGGLYQLDTALMQEHYITSLCHKLVALESLNNGYFAYLCAPFTQFDMSGEYRDEDKLKILNVYSKDTVWESGVSLLKEAAGVDFADAIRTWSDNNGWYIAAGTYQDLTIFRHKGSLPEVPHEPGFTYIAPGAEGSKDGAKEGKSGGGGAYSSLAVAYLLINAFIYRRRLKNGGNYYRRHASKCSRA